MTHPDALCCLGRALGTHGVALCLSRPLAFPWGWRRTAQQPNPCFGCRGCLSPPQRGCPVWALPSCSLQQLKSFELPLEALPAPKSRGFGEPELLDASGAPLWTELSPVALCTVGKRQRHHHQKLFWGFWAKCQ